VALTGGLVLVSVIVVAVASSALLILLWPRWTGRTGILARVALVAGHDVALLVAVAVLFNDHFGFFADWTDLGQALGVVSSADGGVNATAGGDPRAAVAAVGTGGDPFPVSTSLPGPAPGMAVGVGGGVGGRQQRYLHFTVTGARSGARSQILVALPRGYADPANRRRRYPVIETFPGYPGTPFNPSRALDALVTQRRMAPAIVLSATMEIPRGRDTECVDGGGGAPAVETFLTQDVPEWATQHLRVSLHRSGWATAGISAGGWCAAMAAMLHPDRYSAAIVLGGYFRPQFGSVYAPLPPASAAAARYDLISLARRRPPPIALWLQTSPADQVSFATSRDLLAAARAPLAVHSLVMSDTGHRLAVWLPLLPQAFTWLASCDPAFAPATASPDRTTW